MLRGFTDRVTNDKHVPNNWRELERVIAKTLKRN